jgi:hypothetical protein
VWQDFIEDDNTEGIEAKGILQEGHAGIEAQTDLIEERHDSIGRGQGAKKDTEEARCL